MKVTFVNYWIECFELTPRIAYIYVGDLREVDISWLFWGVTLSFNK